MKFCLNTLSKKIELGKSVILNNEKLLLYKIRLDNNYLIFINEKKQKIGIHLDDACFQMNTTALKIDSVKDDYILLK